MKWLVNKAMNSRVGIVLVVKGSHADAMSMFTLPARPVLTRPASLTEAGNK